MPAHAGCRNRDGEPRRERPLGRRERAEVRDCGGRARVDGVPPACRRCERPVVSDRDRERRPGQRDDDLYELPGGL